jgi:hypothetical protein
VAQGECLSSIAKKYGLAWETIWNHRQNVDLARRRKDPNVLFPGDVLQIPERQLREHPASTDQRHRFILKCKRAKLRLQLMRGSEPRANERYVLVVDGILSSGTTNGEG